MTTGDAGQRPARPAAAVPTDPSGPTGPAHSPRRRTAASPPAPSGTPVFPAPARPGSDTGAPARPEPLGAHRTWDVHSRAARASASPSALREQVRRSSADPVWGLLQRYRELCERAVDPLEIAAGLEVHGVTDQTAARFRHRDVFSLAEELYARAPHPQAPVAPAAHTRPASTTRARLDSARRTMARVAVPLLPGAFTAAWLVGLAATPGERVTERAVIGALGGLAVVFATRLALRPLPLGRTALLALGWLLGYALYGDWLLGTLARGGDLGTGPRLAGGWAVLVLAGAVAPAAWCAGWFGRRARRRLAASRTVRGFTVRVRVLLAVTLASFTTALLGLEGLAGLVTGAVGRHADAPGRGWAADLLGDGGLGRVRSWLPSLPEFTVPGWESLKGALSRLDGADLAVLDPGAFRAAADDGTDQGAADLGTAELGRTLEGALSGAPLATAALVVLLFTALLLARHGFSRAATTGLVAAAGLQAVAVGAVLAARLPALAPLGRPVEWLVTEAGPACVPAAACGVAALALLLHAGRVLTRASVHHRESPW